MHEPLQIIFTLKSPVIMKQPINLDALLAYSVYLNTRDLNKAHNELPLSRTEDVWHSSFIRFESPLTILPISYTSGLKQDDQDKRQFQGSGKNLDKYNYIDQKRGEFKATLQTYQGFESKSQRAHFFCHGDKNEIKSLLTNIYAIGKKHQQGYGAIEKVEVVSIEEDYSLYHPRWGVMRNIPCDAKFNINTHDTDTELLAIKPPYWENSPILCFVPNSVTIDSVENTSVDNFF